jgi:hypothetical protein
MKIEKTSVVEEFVDSERHVVAYAEYCTERVGSWTQMGYFA